MLIIGFSGKAEHGKTTAAQGVEKYLKEQGYKVAIVPLAKRLKEQAKLLGWDGEKDEKGRRLLQELSWPIKNYHGEDIYAKWCIEEAINNGLEIVLVDDIRMYAEVKYFCKYSRENNSLFQMIRVDRPNHKSKLTPEQLNDISETQLDDYIFEYGIENKGTTEEFQSKAIKCVKEILNKKGE